MRSASLRFTVASILVLGCGGNGVPPIPSDAGGRDAQPRDAAPDDAGPVDAGSPSDADVDGGGVIFDPGLCRADPATDVFTVATDTVARVRDVGVAAGATRLGVAWSARAGGFDNVFLAEIPATGAALVSAQQITTGSAIQRDPTIAPNGNGWLLAWYGNPDGDFDVYAEAFEDGRIVTGTSVQRLTMHAGRDDAPALLAREGGALAGWVEGRMSDAQRVPVLRALATTAAPTGAQHDGTAASTAVGVFVLAPRAGGASLAWIESGSAAPDALLQPLDASDAPVGTPHVLSTEHNADGSIDLATTEAGGAVVFGTSVAGIRPEVRGRLIDGSGTPSGPERVITLAPSSGRDASIARLAGGYVLAYRLLGATPMLRLDFRDGELAALDPPVVLDVVPVSASGGKVTIRVSGEGRMIVGWADVDTSAGTTTVRAARVRCD